ncbi:hypothetical protein NQS96_14965 [Pseudoalteromonas shioyasakiensis]|uniref:hypothetical protein n=1 Tax=Pseudoalteromonas TaxID=53246 RepID=UPI000C472B22|nr:MULTISPECIES: hypothetical protein [Pseudoalteromonas]MAB61786.1 hypothetical protein [Pseudoalteromonas sp.]MCG9707441.1 hypothetical protein [Pseudoalteromonas sp. Isolate3]MCP4588217.1 hypothetical protein [Pseudoalteromonas sp.]MCQ8883076.1 hypothetical protein [Pseudoalteromonas shioyasakiensis]NIZ07261.1 hypothetical protein [Pseudoalteromonas sp. HF66]|tara:strand:+ start:9217 stop:9429 length:213 start_codon:yes stop_codon:yes gene_type:complete
MNISGSSLPAMSGGGESAEVYSASLAKKQQKADGAAALALIEGAATSSAAAQTPAKSVTATLGNNVNVYV